MNILITGMSGVGKSTLCDHMKKAGHTTFDLDDIPNLCKLYHPDGSAIADGENFAALNMLKIDYICDVVALEKHIENQASNVFYFGYVDNFSEVANLFDQTVLLTTTAEENKRRMSTRTTTDFAKEQKTQDELMEFKDEWENLARKHGAIIIDASGETDNTAKAILKALHL